MNTVNFTEAQFVDFTMEQMKKILPEDTIITQKGTMEFEIKSDKWKGQLTLRNIWNSYREIGDMNQIIEFLNNAFSAQEKMDDVNNFDLSKNKHMLFPSVRSKELVDSLIDTNSVDARIIAEELLGNLQKVYFLWFEGYSVPLNSTLLNVGEGITEEEIEVAAKENLLKQGWIKHSNVGPLKAGKFYVFNEGRLLFHYQFFIKEWVEKHLGSEFYFSFPNKNIALVFVPDEKAKTKHILFDRNFLLANTLADYDAPYPMSKHVFSYRNEDYNVVL